jgi:ribosome-associated heat shock protein Hsp15
MSDVARLDKWLWAARIYKTRSLAIDACKNGRVTKDGQRLKPSHMVKAGDVVSVRKPPVTYSFRIKQPIERRVGAKLVPAVLENVTPPEQYELLEMSRISGFVGRAKGMGRPTKRDRRKMDEFTAPVYMDDASFDDVDDDDDDDDFDFDLEDLERR